MGLGRGCTSRRTIRRRRRELEFAAPTAAQAGSNRISLWALVWLARTRFALADWSGALQAVDQGEILLGATGLELLRPLVHWTGAQVRALRGEPDATERHLRLGGAAEHDYTVMTVPALLARAHAAEAASDYHAVVRHLAPLAARAPRGGLDEPGFWPWHDTYANALVLTDRLADADAFLIPLEATARLRRHRSACARLGYVRGRLLGARGDLAGAEETFARARDQLAPLPLPYEKARVDFAHGLTLRRAGRRRDAAEVLTAARQSSAALGAQVYVERCDRELKTGRPTPRGTESAAGHLTEQERTVAALVATGMSNREVAAEMMLSVKTVQFHLTRVYAKLMVRVPRRARGPVLPRSGPAMRAHPARGALARVWAVGAPSAPGLPVAHPDVSRLLGRPFPVTWLLGGESRDWYGRLHARVDRTVPGAPTERIPGAGHLAHVEAPEVFAQAVVRALTVVESGAGSGHTAAE